MTTDWSAVLNCVNAARDAKAVLKFVVFEEIDYAYVKDAAARFPQLHVLLWGNKRGV